MQPNSVLKKLILLVFAASVHRSDVFAQYGEGVVGWCTVVAPGQSECFGDPMAACFRQYQVYANPLNPFEGYKPYNVNNRLCDWLTHLEGGYITVLPSLVSFKCEPGYFYQEPNRCVRFFEKERDDCQSKGGGSPNPSGDTNPILLSTGAKYESEVDYAPETSRLSVRRHYRSFGGHPRRFNGAVLGLDSTWRFSFAYELHLQPTSFGSAPFVTLHMPNGSTYDFRRLTDGSMTPADGDSNQVPYKLNFEGTWPTNLNTLTSNPTQWKVHLPENRVILFQTFKAIDSPTFSIGRPMSISDDTGYVLTFAYDLHDALHTITDSFGRVITLTWILQDPTQYGGASGKIIPRAIKKMALPDGTAVTYHYDDASLPAIPFPFPTRLSSVRYLDVHENIVGTREYLYEDSRFPTALTGLIDERGVRISTWEYDNNQRASASEHAGGVDRYEVSYQDSSSAATRTVTNPFGLTTTYQFSRSNEILRLNSVAGELPCQCVGTTRGYEYDAQGFMRATTDANGNRTRYTYDSSGRVTSIIEAADTPLARTTTISWHGFWRLPTTIVAPGVTTTFGYDEVGRLITRTETDTTSHVAPYITNGQQRTWAYTYNSAGQVETVDGPRTDVLDRTAYAYDGSGNLLQVTNARGHMTRITEHNARGLPLTVIDPNNVTTSLTYNDRGWLMSRSISGATTALDYDPTGTIAQITLPGGTAYSYEYDSAQRLTAIENNVGERIELTLDAMGNATDIQIKDGDGAIHYTHQQLFDGLGRLLNDIGAEGQTVTFGYDKNDNATSILNPRQFTTSSAFDALNRLYRMTDALSHETLFAYDASDNLVGVTDPRGISTGYVYNGFGELIHESSPDGGDITYVRDSAGNIVQRTDGRGVVTRISYDALNRRITETFRRSPSENRRYIYDNPKTGDFGIGRLHRILDDSGSTTYAYDALGNVVSNRRFIRGIDRKGVSYETRFAYDLPDNLVRMIYPSGRVVEYERDALARVTAIVTKTAAGALPITIARSIAYNPFGSVTGWTYGNGMTTTRSYDLDYRPAALRVMDDATDIYHVELTHDPNGNVAGMVDLLSAARSQTFDYDALDRLVQASSGTAGDGMYGVESFDYDAVGNRIARTGQGEAETYNYTAASNRLNSVSQNSTTVRQFAYDAAGNVVQDDGESARRLIYNHAGRYVRLEENGAAVASYRYNALGERVMKAILPLPKPGRSSAELANMALTHYHYALDRSLIAETTATGATLREYVYLPDANGLPIPIAQIEPNPTKGRQSTSLLATDHLGTPVTLFDTDRQVAWRRTQMPFGETVEEQGSRSTNFRFPGQYFDAESRYSYNMFRDYDSTTGRYLQSDPISVTGGLNRFGYVNQGPTHAIDPLGLARLYFGGFFDRTTNGPVYGSLPKDFGKYTYDKYFSYDEASEASDYIDQLPDCEPIHIYGHSWGADTAAKVTRDANRKINSLTTVDPVSWNRPDYRSVLRNTDRWVNIDNTGGYWLSPDNFIAGLGGAWNGGIKVPGVHYIRAPSASHADFSPP